MSEFIKWAFYGEIPKECTTETAYKCYCIWCELFEYTPLKKFEFMELWAIDKCNCKRYNKCTKEE